MFHIQESERETPVAGTFTVAVCGGGIAGIAAALSAARKGAKVLLVENQFMLGGLGTAGLVTIYLPLCDGEGHQVSFGICEELIRLSVSLGYEEPIPAVWQTPHTPEQRTGQQRYQCRYNPQVFAILCEQLLVKEGVTLLYGSRVCGVQKQKDRITHILVENKGGRMAYAVQSVVDATGDADVCVQSGAGTVVFEQGNSLASWYYLVQDSAIQLKMLGFCDVPDKDGKFHPSAEHSLSAVKYTGLTGEDLSNMTIAAHTSILNNFTNGGGVSDRRAIATIATIPQIRMTRRINGVYTIDDSEERRRFSSSIGMIADWRKKGKIYELPFEILYAAKVKNLICAGRNISTTDTMWDITRVIPVCAVTGEAAGLAAAMCDDFTVLPVAELQKELSFRGIPLHTEQIL